MKGVEVGGRSMQLLLVKRMRITADRSIGLKYYRLTQKLQTLALATFGATNKRQTDNMILHIKQDCFLCTQSFRS